MRTFILSVAIALSSVYASATCGCTVLNNITTSVALDGSEIERYREVCMETGVEVSCARTISCPNGFESCEMWNDELLARAGVQPYITPCQCQLDGSCPYEVGSGDAQANAFGDVYARLKRMASGESIWGVAPIRRWPR